MDAFLRASYADANLSPTDVDTGAVITTGEAAKKENAEAIIHLFAESAGKFVCATVGPNLEAISFILIIDADVGKLLGRILLEVGFVTVISVDNIDIGQLSYVDIGRQLEEARAVPVTVILGISLEEAGTRILILFRM